MSKKSKRTAAVEPAAPAEPAATAEPAEEPAPVGPVLVVDFGTSTTQAAVVEGGTVRMLHEPATGAASWPSAVLADGSGGVLVGAPAERGKRLHPLRYRAEIKRDLGSRVPLLLDGARHSATELVAAVLRAVAAEAHRVLGRAPERTVLTVPAGGGPDDARRQAMLAAAEAAGLSRVGLLAEPVAAAWAPPVGAPFPVGSTVLVHDLGGGTFDAALVRIGDAGPELLGHGSLDDCGGRDLDVALLAHLRGSVPELCAAPPNTDEAAARRAALDLDTFVRELKHGLAMAERVEDLAPDGTVVALDRDTLRAVAAELLEPTVESCRALLRVAAASENTDPGGGTARVDAVLVTGGTSRSPVVRELIGEAFGTPVSQPEDPQLAVVRGAAAWAALTAARDLRPVVREPGTEPLAWDVPGGSAVFLGPLVAEGTRYSAGAVLADVRSSTGTVHRLRARYPGELVRWHTDPGGRFRSGDWLATTVEALPNAFLPVWRHTVGTVHALGWTPGGALRIVTPHHVHEWTGGTDVRRLATVKPAVEGRWLSPDADTLTTTVGNRRTAEVHRLDREEPAATTPAFGLLPGNTMSHDRLWRSLPVGPDRLLVVVVRDPSGYPQYELWTVGDGHTPNLLVDLGYQKFGPDLGRCAGSDELVWVVTQSNTRILSWRPGGTTDRTVAWAASRRPQRSAVHADRPPVELSADLCTVLVGEKVLTTPPVRVLDLAPDGRHVALGLDAGWALVVDCDALTPIAELPHSSGGVSTLAWSHDGSALALAGDGKVTVWRRELSAPHRGL
ncbi:Hsp70 family protein [Kitasatospora purpeofusca]|uniref:Hsp70 family protein n=1 Tax=Kitasatospora purpeofusca TaxID=67352 RepID=UPI0033C0A745